MQITNEVTSSTNRRGFFISLINLLGGMIAAAMAVPAGFYLLKSPKNGAAGDWIELGDVSKLKVGVPEEMVFTRRRTDGWRKVVEKATTWVVRTDQKQVVAFSPSCTHLGCAYHWENSANAFVCPCHTSLFSADGKVLGGPAARPLDRYVSKVENGKILIGPQIDTENS